MANFWENVKDPRMLAGMPYGKDAEGNLLYPEYSGGDLGNMATMAGHELLYQDRSGNGNNPSVQNIQSRLGISPSWSQVKFENLPTGYGGDTKAYASGNTESIVDPRGSAEHVRDALDHELAHAKEFHGSLTHPESYNPSASNTGRHFNSDTPRQMFNRSGKRSLELMLQRLNSNPWGQIPK